ncbi:glycosyltransferase family 2 protein [Alteromonas sp. ASW11-19]|uniref:Glycosyltransferase family 2 protein n=1 Tax=Alteromonas salexigens TaxID=2982530 RepID=A0ABT2VMZ4_9ALTE|nr:glycosyltransferase family 2 protein [Alteromonas salexigens]MCU7554454.1 glycosyltransferase family 2 protein [Alteromonas salexigens]
MASLFRKVRDVVLRRTDKAPQKPSVKLVAIAKNEAAYLPEWLYHHLYIGVDHIEVHYNRCSDNTENYREVFANEPRVEFINADDVFNSSVKNPQTTIYLTALKSASAAGFTHCLFIDVDEFLTPQNLNEPLSALIERVKDFDVLVFQWGNKKEPAEPFSPAISQQLALSKNVHVKALVSTTAKVKAMTPHGPTHSALLRKCVTGGVFIAEGKEHALLSKQSLSGPMDSWFIVHRMFRSQIEYVSLLGRGRPNKAHKNEGIASLKSNRNGYGPFPHLTTVTFDEESYRQYSEYMQGCLSKPSVQREVDLGRRFVKKGYSEVIDLVKRIPPEHADRVNRALKRVDIPEVKAILQDLNDSKSVSG